MPTSNDSTVAVDDILIVDDETANLQLLSELLGREGYQVRPANSPQLAIESALAHPPSLILLDVRMPEMDGFEVCRRLKQEERTCDIPIIFISALQDVRDKVHGFEAGGVDFVSKPFQEEEVLARVRTHMNLRNMQLNLEEMVTERTAEVKEREERFRATFEQAAVGVAHLSPEGKFLRLNRKFCDIARYPQEELLDMTFQDITHPDHLDSDLEFVRQMLQGHIENYTMETRYIRKEGSIVWVSLTVSLVSDEDGNPKYFVSVIEDISERKRIEDKLTKSEEKYRGLVDNSIVGVFASTLDGRFTFANDALAWMFDFDSPEQMMAEGSLKRWRNLKDRERMMTELQQYSSVTNYEAKIITHTDRHIHILLSAKQSGSDIFGMVMDITDRKQAEQKIIAYQQRLKALASQLTIAEENARRSIATDLHDNVSQSLALARLQLASARKLASEPKLADKLGDISTTLLGTLGEIQKLMLELSSPSMHELGISSAISEWLDEQIEKKYNLKTEVIDNIPLNRQKTLASNVRAILFRNVRELVVNVVKHARANQICVRLEDRNTNIRIIVEDDGIGFDPHAETPAWRKIGGFGLFSIEELMVDLGGNLKIVSMPGKGCTAILSVPFSVHDSKERN